MNNSYVKESLNKSVKALQSEPLLLIGTTLLAAFVSAITLGILGLVTYLGLASMILVIDKGKKVRVGELFQHMDKIIYLLVLGFLMGIAVFIGFMCRFIVLKFLCY